MLKSRVYIECDRCGDNAELPGRISNIKLPEGWMEVEDYLGNNKQLCPCCKKVYLREAERINKEMGFKIL